MKIEQFGEHDWYEAVELCKLQKESSRLPTIDELLEVASALHIENKTI